MGEQRDFDVFLCYNSVDRPAVKQIGEQLKKFGILPWFDEWESRPGLPWQRLLEQQIPRIKAAAVFVGKNGIGPWQERELDAFLRKFVNQGCPVIPVLLYNAPVKPLLPSFLEGMTWVDFRCQDPNPMMQLYWGITGKRELDEKKPPEDVSEVAKVSSSEGQESFFSPKPRSRRSWRTLLICVLLAVTILLSGSGIIWYVNSLHAGTTHVALPTPFLIQQKSSQPGATTLNAVEFDNPVKAEDLIVVAITQYDTVIKGTPSDNHHNVYTPVRSGSALFANPADHRDYVELYYAKKVIGGDIKITVTFTSPPDQNAGDSNVGIYEFSGLNKALPLVGPIVSRSGSGNIPDGGKLITTQENEVIFVVGVDSGLDNQKDPNINTPISPGKGYLLLDQQDDAVNYERFYTEYQIAASGMHSTDFSLKYSSYWAVIGAIFKP